MMSQSSHLASLLPQLHGPALSLVFLKVEYITSLVRWFSAGLVPLVGLDELWYQATLVDLGRGAASLSGSQS